MPVNLLNAPANFPRLLLTTCSRKKVSVLWVKSVPSKALHNYMCRDFFVWEGSNTSEFCCLSMNEKSKGLYMFMDVVIGMVYQW